MARDDAPPFDRGQTYYGGNTIDSNDLGGTSLLGQEWEFEDIDYSDTGAKAFRTGRRVRVRAVRNSSGAALLPKRVVSLNADGTTATGYTDVTAERGFPVDEWLPAAGVPANDVFYVVVRGPATVLTALAGATITADIAAGDIVIACTAVTSGATTAGRVRANQAATSGTLILADAVGFVGYAISAVTTGNTNSDLLIDVVLR